MIKIPNVRQILSVVSAAVLKANPLPLTVFSDFLKTYCTLYKEHQQKNETAKALTSTAFSTAI